MSIKAMKMALEALDIAQAMQERHSIHHAKTLAAYDALRAAIAEAQSPRKPLIPEDMYFLVAKYSSFKKHWIGDEVFANLECDGAALARAVERAHGIGVPND